MLRIFANLWFHRFKYNNPPPPPVHPSSTPPSNNHNKQTVSANANTWLGFLIHVYGQVHVRISYKKVGPLIADDIMFSAIDYHCSSVVSVDCLLLYGLMFCVYGCFLSI